MLLALSQPVVDGLQHLGVEIPSELGKKLIANTVKMTLCPDASIPPVPELKAISTDKVSRCEAAIVSLFALATRHCCDAPKLRALLDAHALHKTAVEDLVRAYEEHQKDYLLQHLHIANTMPHITDVEWKIVCDVKSSTSDCSSGELTFHVNLGKYHAQTGQRENIVEFLCNTEELQSLLNKLKEIERHCENMAYDK